MITLLFLVSIISGEPVAFTAEEWDRIATTFTVHMKNGDTVYAKPIWTELGWLVEVSRETNKIPQLPYSFPISNLTHKVIIDPEKPATKWQWDDARENNRLAEVEEKSAKSFNATNTNRGLTFMSRHYLNPIHATTNNIELGYRADGVVVWRVPPEAK